jgi:cytochrome c peroxidase
MAQAAQCSFRRRRRAQLHAAAPLLLLCVTAGCRSREKPPSPPSADHRPPPSRTAFYANTFAKKPTVRAMTATGRTLFSAVELSESGKQSCASCHQPDHAFGPGNDLPVQRGGLDGESLGVRSAPSLRYLQMVPGFNEHYEDSDGDGSDQGPAGGLMWDGRARTTHDQARLPLFSLHEMANRSPDTLVARLRGSRLAQPLRETFGDNVLDSTESGMKAVLMALEVFQQSPQEFSPFSSKYDAYLRRQVKLTGQEERGLRLFNDPKKGNCASCHPSRIKEGGFPLFTDFGFNALGAPRNTAIPANADAHYFDLGLCGPLREDLKARRDFCGLFRTPSLRNVAVRRRLFHNGVFTSLKDVLRFYAQRDSAPTRFYSRGSDGRVRAYDDLPVEYRANLNREPPFGGGPPRLNEGDIEDMIAFLRTLTDADLRPRGG